MEDHKKNSLLDMLTSFSFLRLLTSKSILIVYGNAVKIAFDLIIVAHQCRAKWFIFYIVFMAISIVNKFFLYSSPSITIFRNIVWTTKSLSSNSLFTTKAIKEPISWSSNRFSCCKFTLYYNSKDVSGTLSLVMPCYYSSCFLKLVVWFL